MDIKQSIEAMNTKLRLYESCDNGIITKEERDACLQVLESFMDEYVPVKAKDVGVYGGTKVASSVKMFLLQKGGVKTNCYIKVNGDEYEVRAVLTLDDGEYSLKKSIKSILKASNNKLIPIAVDSGSNYYCVDLKGTTVYRDCHEEDGFEKLCSFAEFKKQIK